MNATVVGAPIVAALRDAIAAARPVIAQDGSGYERTGEVERKLKAPRSHTAEATKESLRKNLCMVLIMVDGCSAAAW